jgi:Mce-associated membrane protein
MAEGAEGDSSAGDADQADTGEQQTDTVEHQTDVQEQGRWRPEVRLAVAAGAVALLVSVGLAGWISYGAWRCHQADQQRELFLRAARQDAQDMTTIRHTEVESDVQRILDLSIGTFHDDFAQRRQPFIEHIKHEQSTSLGTVTEAGLESVGGNSARALVAISVKLSKAGNAEQKLDGFRLRINLQRVGAGVKVSDVEYVQ